MSQVDNLIPEHIKSSLSDAENDSDGEINMDRVPFAKNTIRMDLKQIDRSLKAMSAQQNKENMKNTGDPDENQNRSVTPVNEVEPGQPLTPTANLKVLFNAMSPELRNRDEQKLNSDEDVFSSSQEFQFETIIEVPSSAEAESKFGPSRKEKSLGLLCQRFLQMYPEHPEQGEKIEICLDEVASELQVERRRIYDIVNVLESVEIVSRVAKNRYAWHGKRNLGTTLAKLKALGDSERFGEQIQKLKDFEFNRELEEQFGRSDPRLKANGMDADFSIFGESSLFNQAALRKDKSLGIMSQKFLMLFLVSRPKTVNLDLAAKLLIGDANIDRTESSKFKTKIRRLYDIANILTSLGLIRKVHVTEIRGRKPAFKYTGPDVDLPTEVNLTCCTDGCHRPSTRHSILDCVQNTRVAKIIDTYNRECHTKKPDGTKEDKLRFSRHTSFETLCAVASVETDKLNASAPSSPVKGTPASDSDGESKLPTRGFVRKRPIRAEDGDPNSPDSIIIKTRQVISGKQPTVIPLTKDQIDAVLRSLKVPVPVKKTAVTDAQTQSSPPVDDQIKIEDNVTNIKVEKIEEVEMKELNEKTPVVTINTPDKGIKRPAPSGDTIPLDKRVKLTFSSPNSVGEEKSPILLSHDTIARLKKKVIDDKPSPQRALHLTPEFTNPKNSMMPSGDASSSQTQSDGDGKPHSKKIEIIINDPLSSVQTTKLKPSGIVASSPVVRPAPSVVHYSTSPRAGTILQSPRTNAGKTVVQLTNQPSAILHLPVMPLQQNVHQRVSQASTLTLSPGIQIIQNGQQIMHLPVSLSPMTQTSTMVGSPRVITYTLPSSQTITNIQLVPAQTGSNMGSPLVRPIATKVTASPRAGSQIVAPQIVSKSPVYIHSTPGGFMPISTAAASVPKVLVASSNLSMTELPTSAVLTKSS
ncbi:transcription factor E2F8-like isoform X2 [Mya arenaria]|nr:transcription factor E2F8-like isoform X2 [Mya arenaria]